VDGVKGSQLNGQHCPGSNKDAVIEPNDIDSTQHLRAPTDSIRFNREKGPSDLGSSQSTCHQGTLPAEVSAQGG
jgi:hypothetical protein